MRTNRLPEQALRCLLFALCSFLAANAVAQKTALYATLSVANPSPFGREEVVSIPWQEVQNGAPALDTAFFSVWEKGAKTAVPHQFETGGTGAIQNLLVLVKLPAKTTKILVLSKAGHRPFRALTYGRFVPERKDDFAWENNRIAFRMYGKALEKTSENAYGIDVWTKRTDSLVVDNWYRTGDYHQDHGQGLDYYSVGFTLGAGDVAAYVDDSLHFSHNFHRWEVLDNGPLRTTFRLHYPDRELQGKKLSVSKTISLDAGSQLNRITASYTTEGGELPLAVGIVRREKPGVQWLDEQAGVMGYWEPTHPAAGTTGVGVISTVAPVRARQKGPHWLFTGPKGGTFTYYAGACWDKAGFITTATQWFAYLQAFRQRLQAPLKVRVTRAHP